MNRIYFRLNWRDYFRVSEKHLKKIKKESLSDLYKTIYKEIRSAVSQNRAEQLIALDDSTRTVISVPKQDYKEILNECMKHLLQVEEYEACAEIRDLCLKIDTKMRKKKKSNVERLLLIKKN